MTESNSFTNATDAAGKLFIYGFNGTSYTRPLGDFFRKVKPAGVILFSNNIENAQQTKSLISDLKKLGEDVTGGPIFVCVDQEGGRVSRLSPDMPSFPPARTLGEDGSAELVEETYASIGRELARLGFNVDFAPVLDIDTNRNSPVIGDRSFSADPEIVAKLGVAAIRGIRKEGLLLACGKHFPGHGDTTTDSHLDLPIDKRPMGRLLDSELLPFKEAVDEKVDMIMTAHVLYPDLDRKFPATLSKAIITGILREEIGYDGIIISDDLDMKALAGKWPDNETPIRALNAGCDILLVCHEGPRREIAHEAVIRAIDNSYIDGLDLKLARINRALAKIDK